MYLRCYIVWCPTHSEVSLSNILQHDGKTKVWYFLRNVQFLINGYCYQKMKFALTMSMDLVTRRLEGLRSLCMILCLCRYSTPLTTCANTRLAVRSGFNNTTKSATHLSHDSGHIRWQHPHPLKAHCAFYRTIFFISCKWYEVKSIENITIPSSSVSFLPVLFKYELSDPWWHSSKMRYTLCLSSMMLYIYWGDTHSNVQPRLSSSYRADLKDGRITQPVMDVRLPLHVIQQSFIPHLLDVNL